MPDAAVTGSSARARRTAMVAMGVALGLLVGGLWFLLTTPLGQAGEATTASDFYELGTPTQGLVVGQLAPELGGDGAGGALVDLAGEPVSLRSLRGRPVWIVFWATWCPPCQAETPDIRDAYKDHASEGLALIAVDIEEPPDIVQAYVDRYDLTYTVALDLTAAQMRSYGVFGIPTHYFIDAEGRVRDRYYGPLTRDQMERRLAAILGD